MKCGVPGPQTRLEPSSVPMAMRTKREKDGGKNGILVDYLAYHLGF